MENLPPQYVHADRYTEVPATLVPNIETLFLGIPKEQRPDYIYKFEQAYQPDSSDTAQTIIKNTLKQPRIPFAGNSIQQPDIRYTYAVGVHIVPKTGNKETDDRPLQKPEERILWSWACSGRVAQSGMCDVCERPHDYDGVPAGYIRTVLPDIELKGTGLNRSVQNKEGKPFQEKRWDGLFPRDSALYDLRRYIMIRNAGILTGVQYPPVMLDEIRGKDKDDEEIRVVVMPRGVRSSVKVVQLNPFVEGRKQFHLEKQLWKINEPHVAQEVHRRAVSLVEHYLQLAQQIKALDPQAEMGVGTWCGEPTLHNYAQAFTKQMATTAARMIQARLWDNNIHTQNFTIAGERLDFDSWFRLDNEDQRTEALRRLKKELSDSVYLPEEQEENALWIRLIYKHYKIAATTAAILNQDIPTIEDFFSQMQEQLPQGHAYKKYAGWTNFLSSNNLSRMLNGQTDDVSPDELVYNLEKYIKKL